MEWVSFLCLFSMSLFELSFWIFIWRCHLGASSRNRVFFFVLWNGSLFYVSFHMSLFICLFSSSHFVFCNGSLFQVSFVCLFLNIHLENPCRKSSRGSFSQTIFLLSSENGSFSMPLFYVSFLGLFLSFVMGLFSRSLCEYSFAGIISGLLLPKMKTFSSLPPFEMGLFSF